MRALSVLSLTAMLVTGQAMAQTAVTPSPSAGTGTGTGSSNGAVNDTGNVPSTVNASGTIQLVPASALESGSNSFTEGQVRSRIESAGFSNVTGLAKDDQGIWRGKAKKDARSLDVGFDYKGNMSAN